MWWIAIFSLLLNVPFVSQVGVGWYNDNDCGPASVAMVYEYYTDQSITPKELYEDLMPEDKGMSGFMLRQWLREQGLGAEYYTGQTMEWLSEQDQPVIVEVDYSVLRKAQVLDGATWYKHFMVVVGVYNRYVTVHDPLTGPYKNIPISIFSEAWSLPASWMGNVAVVVEG